MRKLAQLHDDVLFLRAFPDNAAIALLAQRCLHAVSRQLERQPLAVRDRFEDSGMAGSKSRHTFPFALARWLVRSFPNEVEIDWAALEDETVVSALIRSCLTRAEEDGYDDPTLSMRQWLRVAKPASIRSTLSWLVRRAESDSATRRLFATVYDVAPLPIVWRLTRSTGSTTFAQLQGPHSFRSAMRRPPVQPVRHIATPLPGIRLLRPAEAARVIHVARCALTSRCREVFATSHATPDEVWWADLGEGVALAIIGAAPDRRMSLETNYGYMLLSNGVPIGYGGVTPLFHQANTGINIFEAFRGSEAAFLFAQMLRAFRSLFGIGRIVVNPYQFGAGNNEAIESGAFWFYYRLGFRPGSREGLALAEREAATLARTKGHRSSPATLRKLAHDDLYLDLPGFSRSAFFPEALLSRCALRVTERRAACESTTNDEVVARVAKALAVPSRRLWPTAERQSFELLAPVADLLPGIDRWSPSDKRQMVALLRAKGRRQERDFILLSQRFPRFWRELMIALRASHP
ncbi:MAG: hypothetical protein MNPFHGCM_02214 [Gemmatimonadaceae bacterium]|nr:hypothetical protein [Gemmatimonadaceae bacterium]